MNNSSSAGAAAQATSHRYAAVAAAEEEEKEEMTVAAYAVGSLDKGTASDVVHRNGTHGTGTIDYLENNYELQTSLKILPGSDGYESKVCVSDSKESSRAGDQNHMR